MMVSDGNITPYRTNFVVLRDDVSICVQCKHIRWQGVGKLCAAAPPEKIEPCEIDPVTGHKRGGVTLSKCVDVNVDGQCEHFERHTTPAQARVRLIIDCFVGWAVIWALAYGVSHLTP